MIKAFSISITAEMQTTIKILLVTLGGLVYLYKVCEPLDMYRGILYSAITMLMIIWVFFLMDLEMFGLQSIRPLKDNWQYLLIMLCILELNFPLLRIISKIINKIKITPDYIND
jgi:cation-transporting ATPase E